MTSPVVASVSPGDAGVPPDVSEIVLRQQTQAMRQELDALVGRNIQGMQELQAKGIGFDPGQIINGRIDTVISAMAQAMGPQGALWELQTRLLFERQMAENVATAKRQGTKVQLSQASSLSAADIRNLARQTGTYGGR